MNVGLLAAKLILLLLVCSFGPGLIVVRRLRWSPLEKLCAAIGVSFVLTYLASLILFCCNAEPAIYWATSCAFAVAGCFGYRQLAIFLHRRRTRAALIGLFILLCWDFLHLAMARQLAGGGWGGDWNEHYDRTRFFLRELPSDYLFLNRYMLPARPPMMNLIAAFFCRQVGMSFEAFSLVFLFLNVYAFVPCCLLMGRLGKHGARYTAVLTILFMLNPSIIQNATWGWTKALAAGFVVLGVCYYLRGLKARGMSRMIAAALCLAAAILVHYSAIPFALAIIAHYVWMLASNRRTSKEALAAGASAAALLASWFGWSIAVYGAVVTFYSNTTAAGTARETTMDTISKVFYNAFTSLVPHPLHTVTSAWFEPIRTSSDVRDYFFLMSQTTLTMMVGSLGGLVAAILLIRYLLSRDLRLKPEKHFWIVFLVIGFVTGTAANPAQEQFGCAHVTLQTLALMGVTLVAANLMEMRPFLFNWVLTGTMIDYWLGIFLNFDCRTHIFPPVGDATAWVQKLLNNAQGLDGQQYGVKLLFNLTFWGDHLAAMRGVLEAASVLGAVTALFVLVGLRFSAVYRAKQQLS